MISCFANGFIAEKPSIQMVGTNRAKCEITVIWGRSVKRGTEWETAWERAVFVAWDEEAERVASRLDKGTRVSCTGTQETSSWADGTGQKRYSTKFRLTSWVVERQNQPQAAPDGRQQGGYASRQDRPAPAGGHQSSHRPSPAREPMQSAGLPADAGYGDYGGQDGTSSGYDGDSRGNAGDDLLTM